MVARDLTCYDRFHAWQSSLLFTVLFIVHLIFSWSTFLSWVIFLGDLALMVFLAMRAYRDADTLDRQVHAPSPCPPPLALMPSCRYEVPIFGQFASRILDDE